ncbi:Uncharacterized protein SAMN04487948_10637 [Halogranum amylolyticum]|uniref:Tat (Twin-arginine translocation) pathway signal sequence n=1 Tax=Halogranum amylolyticum TaxID=660520 RepID=A0A1H8T5N5_9EURY|nr:hypothetical protein [Halogranum amylolyticum]SEO86419.1 Uncharacterized protein SAMN04487948_10637 [Halogranum amylolyticum]
MSDRTTSSRRAILKGIGTAAATAGIAGLGGASTDEEWHTAETPTDSTLHGVEHAVAGAYAVGGGGVVLERGAEGWTKVLDGGPTGNGNDLYGTAVTDGGKRLWFVGSSGAIGEYDVETGNLDDHSAPMDVTNNFNSVAVTGTAGDANVYVAGDSGKIYYSFENGETGTWDDVTPGSGAALPAIDFHGVRSGHAVDTNGTVFATDDGGTWEAIGIGDANVNLYGVDSDAADDVTVVGGGGMVFRHDGAQWTPTDLGDKSLRDVTFDDGDGYTVGGGGAVFDATGGQWSREQTPSGENLTGVSVGDRVVVVGAGGTVLEQ